MKLADFPESEIVRLSKNTQVKSYSIGFDIGGKVVLWKFQFTNGNTALYFLPPAVACHFTKATRRVARKFKWPLSDYPNHAPEITKDDWDGPKSKHIITTQQKTIAYRDCLISTLQVGKDLFQVIRLSPEQAVQIAELHWTEIQSGRLRDIADEIPQSDSRN